MRKSVELHGLVSRLVLPLAMLPLGALGTTSCASEEPNPPATPDTSSTTTPPSGGTDSTSDTAAQADDPTDPDAPRLPLARNIALTDIAVFQAVKTLVAKDGKSAPPPASNPASNGSNAGPVVAPVVAGRPAVVRAYVEPLTGFTRRDITAELRLTTGGKKLPVLRATRAISGTSRDETPASAFDFEVAAESIATDTRFEVSLVNPSSASSTAPAAAAGSPARFPRDGGDQSLGAKASGAVRIVVVPVRYDATNGSGELPDVSDAQIALYRQTMMSRYPASAIEITVRKAVSWTTTIGANGTGFSSLLRAITQLRQQDGADKDVYYYGLLAPAPSFRSFCAGGCVTGLSTVVESAANATFRASIGVGFSGTDSAETMAHEVGHAHGRQHAPCGDPEGPDPDFPYTNGRIGVWGWDMFSKSFINPTRGTDMMGYCPNEWVSDYTFAALFTRIATISPKTSTPSVPGASGAPGANAARRARSYRVATALANGSLAWDGELDANDDELDGGEAHLATIEDGSGAALATRTVRFFKFDHLPGGFVLVPNDAFPTQVSGVAARAAAVRVTGFGGALPR